MILISDDYLFITFVFRNKKLSDSRLPRNCLIFNWYWKLLSCACFYRYYQNIDIFKFVNVSIIAFFHNFCNLSILTSRSASISCFVGCPDRVDDRDINSVSCNRGKRTSEVSDWSAQRSEMSLGSSNSAFKLDNGDRWMLLNRGNNVIRMHAPYYLGPS